MNEAQVKQIGLIARHAIRTMDEAIENYEKLQNFRESNGINRSTKLDARIDAMRALSERMSTGEHKPSTMMYSMLGVAKILTIPGTALGIGKGAVAMLDKVVPVRQIFEFKGMASLAVLSYGFIVFTLILGIIKIQMAAIRQFTAVMMLYYAGKIDKEEADTRVNNLASGVAGKIRSVTGRLTSVFSVIARRKQAEDSKKVPTQ